MEKNILIAFGIFIAIIIAMGVFVAITKNELDEIRLQTPSIEAENVPMKSTVDEINRRILITGAISSNENIIQVIVPNVPVGKWTVIKSEVNLTDESWKAWEIVFGDNTELGDITKVSSRQFKQFTAVPERNALVFHDGKVVPGESVSKIFEVEQIVVGDLVMSHNRVQTPITPSMIENGFRSLPTVSFELTTDYLK